MMKEVDLYIKPEFYVEMHEWCETNFGHESEERWKMMANNDVGGTAFFMNDVDAMAFKLRWL